MQLALIGLGASELIIILVGILAFTFWIWMVVDCVTKETDPTQKIVWIILIAVVGVVGAPLYFFLRKLPRRSVAAQVR